MARDAIGDNGSSTDAPYLIVQYILPSPVLVSKASAIAKWVALDFHLVFACGVKSERVNIRIHIISSSISGKNGE